MKGERAAKVINGQKVLTFPGVTVPEPVVEDGPSLRDEVLDNLIKETHEILDESIKNAEAQAVQQEEQLPVFVRKMKTINSIEEQLQMLEGLNRELSYYLDEIETFS